MDFNLEIEKVPRCDIHPAKYNPRQITDEMLEKLKKSLMTFGFVDPLIINTDGTVIGGHQRLTALEALVKDKTIDAALLEGIPCIRMSLDAQHEKALNLALNKISGEWRYDKLTEILSELATFEEIDIEATGFDKLEIGDLEDSGGTGFGAPSLLDIFNKDAEVKSGNTLNPGQVVIASIGSFIQGFKRTDFPSEAEYDELRGLVDKLQVHGTNEDKTAIAVQMGLNALKQLRIWAKKNA